MNRVIVTDKNRGLYGGLLQEQFRQRRDLFVGDFGWSIPSTTVIESDQYDRVDTVYVIIEDEGRVVGYARLLQTTSRVRYGTSEFSYMVRDAALGILPGIDPGILPDQTPPSSVETWEMTRVEARDRKSLAAIFDTASLFLSAQGATHTITFTRQSFSGILNKLGYRTTELGPRFDYGGQAFCVLSTRVSKHS